jgi:hypothetical protein
VGSGWQSYVAYINLGCYYLIGVPLGFFMGWVFHQGVMVSILNLFLLYMIQAVSKILGLDYILLNSSEMLL